MAEVQAPRSRAWRELVERLDAEMPAIVDDFVREFSERGRYDRDAVGEQDLRDTAEDTLRMLVARMAGGTPTAEDATLAASLGVRRARQGVQLDALLEAVRLDFRVLWRWLQRLAGDEQRAALVEQVEWVLTVVEQYVDEVQQSFLRETAAMQRDVRLATERHLARLLSGDAPRPSAIDAIAQGLGVAADAQFDLLAVPVDRIEEAQHAADARLAAGSIFGHSHGDAYCLFWVRGTDGRVPDELVQVSGVLLQRLPGLPAVATGARTALALLATAPTLDGLTGVDELWPAVAAARLDELVPGFAAGRLAPLDDLTDYQREAILTTVRTYLVAGSVHVTSKRVFCHRNTVLNRLAAFRDRTGLDVQVPVEAALAHVLLATTALAPAERSGA
ncbi:helix-turn-helix domain-containing protein [Agrococcus sp. ProA11]|uniref:helix-turn-helix domain-containing protein n=1 Tax=Agrococcus chionoecetis TaxID=3153752 RepID=UPI00326052A3